VSLVRIDAVRKTKQGLVGNTMTESMIGGVSFHHWIQRASPGHVQE
jgi:hypothetical protein